MWQDSGDLAHDEDWAWSPGCRVAGFKGFVLLGGGKEDGGGYNMVCKINIHPCSNLSGGFSGPGL
jgi:hypothetical protein